MTLVSKFPDLYFIGLAIESLFLRVFQSYSEHLELFGDALDFDGLEDDNKRQLEGEICFFVTG
jgi:hypothetical protein